MSISLSFLFRFITLGRLGGGVVFGPLTPARTGFVAVSDQGTITPLHEFFSPGYHRSERPLPDVTGPGFDMVGTSFALILNPVRDPGQAFAYDFVTGEWWFTFLPFYPWIYGFGAEPGSFFVDSSSTPENRLFIPA